MPIYNSEQRMYSPVVLMAVIPIPFIVSRNGVGDSISQTVGLWVILFIVFRVICGLLTGKIALPRMKITGGIIIGAFVVAAPGAGAYLIHPLLLLPLPCPMAPPADRPAAPLLHTRQTNSHLRGCPAR